MAIVKFMNAEMRGSVANTTYSNTPFGAVAKKKAKTPRFNSTNAIKQKSRYKMLAQMWSGVLTGAERTAWDAASANFPHTNSLGDTIYVTGFNLFEEFNGNLILIEEPIITNPPTPAYVPPVTTINIRINNFCYLLLRELIPNPVPSTIQYVLFATNPYKQGIANYQNRLRFVQHTLNGGGNNVNGWFYYSILFGTPITGMKISFETFSVEKISGIRSGRLATTVTIENFPEYWFGHITTTGTFQVGDVITGSISGATAEIYYLFDVNRFSVINKTGIFQNGDLITGSVSGATGAINRIPVLVTIANLTSIFLYSLPFGPDSFVIDTNNSSINILQGIKDKFTFILLTPLSFSPGDTLTQASTGAVGTVITSTLL